MLHNFNHKVAENPFCTLWSKKGSVKAYSIYVWKMLVLMNNNNRTSAVLLLFIYASVIPGLKLTDFSYCYRAACNADAVL